MPIAYNINGSSGGGSATILPGTNVGDITYWDGTQWAPQAPGTNGYFLRTNAIGSAPTWTNTAAAGLVIATGQTLSGQTDLTLSVGAPPNAIYGRTNGVVWFKLIDQQIVVGNSILATAGRSGTGIAMANSFVLEWHNGIGFVNGLTISGTDLTLGDSSLVAQLDGSLVRIPSCSLVIGNTAADATAVLQADSTTKGFLPPRMTELQRKVIAGAATGLQIFDTTLGLNLSFNGTDWLPTGSKITAGVIASRPAASIDLLGTMYYATDQEALYQVGYGPLGEKWNLIWYDRRMPAGTTAPLGWWKCNEASGAATLVNSGSTGAGANMTTFSGCISGRKGPFGNCIVLDGTTNGRAATPAGVIQPVSSITVSIIFKIRSYPASFGFLLTKPYAAAGAYAAPFVSYSTSINNTANGQVTSGRNVGGVVGGATSTLTDQALISEWAQFVSVSDGATVSIYLNGALVGTAASVGNIDWGTNGRWMAGNNDQTLGGAGNLGFPGWIADMRIYDIAQNSAWVQEQYDRLSGWWQGT